MSIPLNAGDTLTALAAVAATVNYVSGGDTITVSGATDSFLQNANGQLGNTSTTLCAPSAGTQALVKHIWFYNTAVSKTQVKVFINSRLAYQALIPANGSLHYSDMGWTIYNSAGAQAEPMVKSDGGSVSGAGPYTLTFAPDGAFTNICLDGVKQLPANYTISGTSLTFVGLTMGSYLNWSADYSY